MDNSIEVVTDLEFIFLGGTKLIHTLREQDTFEDLGSYVILRWTDTGEEARIHRHNLLQEGRRVRQVAKQEGGYGSAVAKVVADIKAREAKAQGAAPATAPSLGSAGAPPSTSTISPLDLWARSPLTR